MHKPAVNSPGRHRFFWLLVCIAILVAGAGGMTLLRVLAPQPREAETPAPLPLVNTTPLTYRDEALQVSGEGIVSARAQVAISAQVSGEVIDIHPALFSGGHFSEGEVLVEIDQRPFIASLEEARAARAVQESNLAFLEKQIERLRSLRERDYVTEETLDELLNQRDQTQANIRRQDAVIQTRSLELEYTRIEAPFDGYILSENVDVGDIVSPGVELAQFYASDALEIVVSLNAGDAIFIPGLWNNDNSGGRNARVEVSHGGQRYQWSGTVDRVESNIDRSSRTVDVVVRVDQPRQRGSVLSRRSENLEFDAPPLLLGMYANVHIEGMHLPRHFTLPMGALHDGHIWTVNDEQRLQVEPVELVRQEGNDAVLLAPQLSPGTEIIVSQIALVSDGMQVRTREQESTP